MSLSRSCEELLGPASLVLLSRPLEKSIGRLI